jgi:serine/threonine protein kinase
LHLNDFGTVKSSIIDEKRIKTTGTTVGTIEYMAPEIHDAKSEIPDITKTDVWAIRVIAYQICTFTLPFSGYGASATMNLIINDPHKPIDHQGYSAELKNLIDLLLTKNFEERLSI